MTVQIIIWDAQSKMFRRDFYAEDYYNRYDVWWESHL